MQPTIPPPTMTTSYVWLIVSPLVRTTLSNNFRSMGAKYAAERRRIDNESGDLTFRPGTELRDR